MKIFTRSLSAGLAAFMMVILALVPSNSAYAATVSIHEKNVLTFHNLVSEKDSESTVDTDVISVEEAGVKDRSAVVVIEDSTPRYTEAPLDSPLPNQSEIKSDEKKDATLKRDLKSQSGTNDNNLKKGSAAVSIVPKESNKGDKAGKDAVTRAGADAARIPSQAGINNEAMVPAEQSDTSGTQSDKQTPLQGVGSDLDLAQTGISEAVFTALIALYVVSLGAATLLAREYQKLNVKA